MMHLIRHFEHLKIHLEAIKSATNNFADDNCIGRGGFGKVYKGELVHSKGQSLVALKRLDPRFGQGNPEFWKEISMLSLYKHDNIVSLLGFCDESDEKILVYEYVSKRSLDMYLNNKDLSWIQRLKICVGAARGLAFLHNPSGTQQRVLHRDIKSSNILLDDNWNAKISDLGLSKFCPANQKYTFLVSNTVGTIGYIDPVYVETGFLTKESDVYSFGVVMFEVLCGRLCISNNDGVHQSLIGLVRRYYAQNKISEIICNNLKDGINPKSLQMFSEIAYQCLKRDLEERPLMTDVVEILERVLEHENGRKINVGDCALFKPPDDSPPFVGIIRGLTVDEANNPRLSVHWLYRPSEVNLSKGSSLKSAENEVFFSFHQDEIPAESLLHPVKVAFLGKGVELPSRAYSFVCTRVYDVETECLWWLTDQDYADEQQQVVNQLLDKTKTEMLKAEIARITDKGGLVDFEGVEKIIQLMQPESGDKKVDLASRIMLLNVISGTESSECLGRFVELRGLVILDECLQEFHKGKIGDGSPKEGDLSVEEFLFAVLLALDKLPVNLHALQSCNVGRSINHLRRHKNPEIYKKASTLMNTWKKRVEAEMTMNVAEIRSGTTTSWSNKSMMPEFKQAMSSISATPRRATDATFSENINNNSYKLIVRLPNTGRSPARTASGGSVQDHVDGRASEKVETQPDNNVVAMDTDSCKEKEGLIGSDDNNGEGASKVADSASRGTLKSGKSYEASDKTPYGNVYQRRSRKRCRGGISN